MKKFVLLLLATAFAASAAPKNLEIYWIDAEGGAATLIVTPSGESMLVDTANRTPDDHDAKRIFAAAQKAGIKKIDVLLTTHFHGDHIGGMQALARMIPNRAARPERFAVVPLRRREPADVGEREWRVVAELRVRRGREPGGEQRVRAGDDLHAADVEFDGALQRAEPLGRGWV
jgi:glyoxylase-like metal-dependent hydrolase (beta-lactamase superfamily II)